MKIQISKPCTEDWFQMRPMEQERFCTSCQKCVRDFTTLSDAEILKIMNSQTGQHCGRFRADQLDRTLVYPNNKKKFYLKAIFSMSWLTLATIGVEAKPMYQTFTEKGSQNLLPTPKQTTGNRTISGIVRSEKGEPLIGAGVSVKGTSDGTVTDLDGAFSLMVPIGQTLVFSYVGYVSRELTVNEFQKNHTEIELAEAQLLNVVIGGYFPRSRWQRFKHFVRNRLKWNR